jgi:DNA-binding beta-propeller fold protein YncE
VTLSGHPKDARYTVVASTGATLSGTLPFTGQLPAGPTTITVSADGYSSMTRAPFLDAEVKLDLWLDPPGQVVRTVSVFECGNSPKGVAVTPDGSQAWVTLLGATPAVEVYDARTGVKTGKVTLGTNGAVEVIFNKAGTKAYVSQMETARVYEIDVVTRRVLRTLDTKSSWTKVVVLSPDERYLYAANWSNHDVSRFDLRTGKLINTYPTVNTPRGLYPTLDGKYVYVAGFGKGDVAKIDLASGKSKTIFSNTGSAMRHMVGDPRIGTVYVSDMGKACVWKLDMKTDKVTRWADVDSHPNTIDLSPDGKVLFVSNRGANNPTSYYIPGPEWGTILLVDTSNGKPLDCIVGGNQCTALDVSDDGRTLIFSDFLDNRMHIYGIPSYEELVAGKGGRYEASRSELKKKGWGSSGGSSTSSASD